MNTQFITKHVEVPRSFTMWLKAVLAAAIGGAANSLGSAVAIATANQVGADIQPLTPSQFKTLCISGAIIGVAGYLKKSPLPSTPSPSGDQTENQNINQP